MTDLLQELIAKFDMDAALDEWLKIAKKQRSEIPYSKDENFPSMLIVLGPLLEAAAFPVTWDTNEEKYMKMKAWSHVAKEADAHAVALVSDTRWTDSEKIGAHFNIPNVKELGLEEFQKRYHEILRRPPHNGQIKNLPRHLWNEAIVIAVKGPTVKLQTRMARYVEGPRDTIEWLKDEPKITGAHFDLIPDWWV